MATLEERVAALEVKVRILRAERMAERLHASPEWNDPDQPLIAPSDAKAGTPLPPHVAAVYEAAMAWSRRYDDRSSSAMVVHQAQMDALAACRAAREVKP